MDKVYVKTVEFQSRLDRSLSQSKLFRDAEAQTKIPKVYLALGAAFFLFTLVFFNIGAAFITNAIGWIYPSYESFKAVESRLPADAKQWLTYWSVFGLLQMLENFPNALLYWLPSYYVFKMVFILWLALPQFRGAQKLYRGIKPFLSFRSPPDPSVQDKEVDAQKTKR